MFLKIILPKFRKFHRKTPKLESLFNREAGLIYRIPPDDYILHFLFKIFILLPYTLTARHIVNIFRDNKDSRDLGDR